jgi:hypothetical protein
MPEMLRDAVERRHDRQCAKMLDHQRADSFGFGIVDGITVSSSIGSERCVPVSSVETRIWRESASSNR